MDTLIWFAIVLGISGLVLAGIAARINLSGLAFIFALFALSLMSTSLLLGTNYGVERFKEKIADEVSLTEVPVRGQVDFTMSVKAHYKDGELDSVELVKGSTKPFP